jgi:hypothetical protein
MAEEDNEDNFTHGKNLLVLLTFVLFLINIWKFLNCPESEIPIISILFNLIIYLGIIIIILHKNEINFKDYFRYAKKEKDKIK